MKRKLITITAVILLLSGCSKHTMSELKEQIPAATTIKPTLEMNVEVSDRTATVTISTDLKLSKEHYNTERTSGEGHLHLYVDTGDKITLTEKRYVIRSLSPGKHIVNVSLHNNDHTPYDVAKQVEFEIK